MDHENIIKFKEVYKNGDDKLCIITEHAAGGDIHEKIAQQRLKKDSNGNQLYFKEEQVLNWVAQIALAVKYCHDRKLLHRDIKPKNVLLTDDGTCKLTDFGCSKVLSRSKSLVNSSIGTPYYVSPEMTKVESYSYKTGIWSLGVLFYEICTLEPPFQAKTALELFQKIQIGEFKDLPIRFSKNT